MLVLLSCLLSQDMCIAEQPSPQGVIFTTCATSGDSKLGLMYVEPSTANSGIVDLGRFDGEVALESIELAYHEPSQRMSVAFFALSEAAENWPTMAYIDGIKKETRLISHRYDESPPRITPVFSPDGRLIFVTHFLHGAGTDKWLGLEEYHVEDDTWTQKEIPGVSSQQFNAITFSPSGTRAALSTENADAGVMIVRYSEDGFTYEKTLATGLHEYRPIGWADNDHLVVSACEPDALPALRTWKLSIHQGRHVPLGSASAIMSPDGQWLAEPASEGIVLRRITGEGEKIVVAWPPCEFGGQSTLVAWYERSSLEVLNAGLDPDKGVTRATSGKEMREAVAAGRNSTPAGAQE